MQVQRRQCHCAVSRTSSGYCFAPVLPSLSTTNAMLAGRARCFCARKAQKGVGAAEREPRVYRPPARAPVTTIVAAVPCALAALPRPASHSFVIYLQHFEDPLDQIRHHGRCELRASAASGAPPRWPSSAPRERCMLCDFGAYVQQASFCMLQRRSVACSCDCAGHTAGT